MRRSGCRAHAWCWRSAVDAAGAVRDRRARADQSNMRRRRAQVTVRSAAEWTTLWQAARRRARRCRAVDFAREMVVGVFLGSRPTAVSASRLSARVGEQRRAGRASIVEAAPRTRRDHGAGADRRRITSSPSRRTTAHGAVREKSEKSSGSLAAYFLASASLRPRVFRGRAAFGSSIFATFFGFTVPLAWVKL